MSSFSDLYQNVKNFRIDFRRGIRKHKKGIFVILGTLFVIFFVFSVVIYNMTNSIAFCSACHNMDPYVESWKASSHNMVACVTCHYEPGIINHLKGKYKDGQVSLVYFITGKTPGKYHAEISDASCLQSGCHDKSELPDDAVYKTIRFSHSKHLLDLRRGKKLRCTTCHGQIVQGAHLKVDPDDCFICHFKVDVEDGKEIPSTLSECTLCHQEVPEEIPINGHTFFHGRYVEDGIPCLTCHQKIIDGKGEVIPGKCIDCHNDPDMIETQYTSEILHKNHVADHKVECYRCHEIITHKIQRSPTIQKFEQSCLGCHEKWQHLGPREIYKGVGGFGVPDSPSPMYLANVDCMSCHEQFSASPSDIYSTHSPESMSSTGVSCNHCHGPGYEKMIDLWQKILLDAEKLTSDNIHKAENAIFTAAEEGKINPKVISHARDLLNKARHNFTFVLNARGHHNINYALKLIEKSVEWSEQANAEVKPGYAPRKIELVKYGCTSLCHVGQESKSVPFKPGIDFPHEPHVIDSGLECNECHGEGVNHGRVILQACNECHHGQGEGRVRCEDCHSDVAEIFQGAGGHGVPPMPSVKADNMSCVDCHAEVPEGKQSTFKKIQSSCGDCHDDDQEEYEQMVVSWKSEAEKFLSELNRHHNQVSAAIHEAEILKQNVILARNQLTMAEHNIEIIGERNCLHNIEYARKLVEATHKYLDKALEELRRSQ